MKFWNEFKRAFIAIRYYYKTTLFEYHTGRKIEAVDLTDKQKQKLDQWWKELEKWSNSVPQYPDIWS